MRPFPDDILRSMRFSLDEYVIPHVDDKWGRYVAKVMKRMLVHLERRWEHEGPVLVEGVADLRAVLADISQKLEAAPGEAGELPERIGRALERTAQAPTRWVPISELTEHSETVREALVDVIESLDRCEAAGESVPADVRGSIRSYLRREVDRDNLMVEPTFMSFAPPSSSASDAA